MVLERLKQLAYQVDSTSLPPHPFDPLSSSEIDAAVAIIRAGYDGSLKINTVTLREPQKAEVVAWLADPQNNPRPHRAVDIVAISPGGKVYDGIVDLTDKKVLQWKHTEGVQPLITMEDLNAVEALAMKDPKIISSVELLEFRQGICIRFIVIVWNTFSTYFITTVSMHIRPTYNHETKEFIHIEVPRVKRSISKAPLSNYNVRSIEIEGVNGRVIDWQTWNIHVGFNYREGIVLNNITFNDKETVRPIFYRLSLAEMVVPYGNPEHSHQRKHAFDLGEYGGG
ncbi:hypothetical protein PABG_11069 [Paracoccidioides brasiliensis Pb03]|nr:hypothetical protein PABG_11069 [Paracoccidioides brasiliensis Pb03]